MLESSKSYSKYLSSSITTFIFLTMLIQFGEPIGNYHDNVRMYLALIFIPALFGIFVARVLLIWISTDDLNRIVMLLLSISLIGLSINIIKFISFNGDSLIYIIGYMLVYLRWWLIFALFFSFISIYLSVLNIIEVQREHRTDLEFSISESGYYEYSKFLINTLCLSLIFITFLLSVSEYVNLGLGLIAGAMIVIYSSLTTGIDLSNNEIEDKLNNNNKNNNNNKEKEKEEEKGNENIEPINRQEDFNPEIDIDNNKKEKTTLGMISSIRDHPTWFGIGLMLFLFSVSFLWTVNWMRVDMLDGITRYYLITPILLFSYQLKSLSLLVILFVFLRNRLIYAYSQFLLKRKDEPVRRLVELLVYALIIYLVELLGEVIPISFKKIQMSLFLTPIIESIIFIALIDYLINREKKPYAPLTIWAFLFGFTSWAGFLLSSDPGDSYYWWIHLLTSLILLGSTIGFLIMIYIKKENKIPTNKNTNKNYNKNKKVFNIKEKKKLYLLFIKSHFNNNKIESTKKENSRTKTSMAKSPSNGIKYSNHFSKNKFIGIVVLLSAILPLSLYFGTIGISLTSSSENNLITPNSYQNYQGSDQFQLLLNENYHAIFYWADVNTRISENFEPNFGFYNYKEVNNTVQINSAKNEWEPLKIVIKALKQDFFCIQSVSFSGFASINNPDEIIIESNESTFESYKINYLQTMDNQIPDVLEHFSPIVVNDRKNHPMWFNFYVPENTPAGDYIGTLRFQVANNSVPNEGMYRYYTTEIKVKLHVYNFRLPKIPTLKTNYGYYTSRDDFDQVMELFKSHRMMHWSFIKLPRATIDNAGHISSINFTYLDKQYEKIYGYGTYTIGFYLDINSILPNDVFEVNGVSYSSSNYSLSTTYNQTFAEYFLQLANYLKTKTYVDDFNKTHTWYEDTYFNGDDEIDARGEEVIAEALTKYDWLKNTVNMSFPIMQTSGYNEEILSYVDIWCQHGVGEDKEEFKHWRSSGKEMWIYTTRGPRFPNPSSSTSGFLLQTRAIPWQCFVFNFSHYLIWDVATPYNGNYGYGYQGWNGGTLMYSINGETMPSVRFELTRESLEDYDYFYLLRETVKSILANNSLIKNPEDVENIIQKGEVLLERINELFVFGYNTIMDYREFSILRTEIGSFLSMYSILK